MYLIISWFYSFGKISGIVPEPKLKNWIFQRDPGRDSPYGFSFSVFLFFSFSVLLTELFRNISGDISEYLRRNWKTEFSREIQEEILHMDSVFQFFCFSVFLFFSFAYGTIPEYFRRHFGIFAEKLKNWKTEFSREIQEEILHMDSVFLFFSFSVLQFFCFSVFLFFSFAYGTIPEYLRRNWKTEKLNFPERSRKRFSIWIQFFSFSVFQFCGRIGQEELDNWILRVSSLHVIQILYMIKICDPPKRSFPNLQAKMCLKHCKYHCFCWKHRFLGGGHQKNTCVFLVDFQLAWLHSNRFSAISEISHFWRDGSMHCFSSEVKEPSSLRTNTILFGEPSML